MAIATAAVCGHVVGGQTRDTRLPRVLFIGNSLTAANDLPRLVAAMSALVGAPLECENVTFDGFSLEDHWNEGSAKRAIARGGWSTVVLQQGPSALPESRMLLVDFIRTRCELTGTHIGCDTTSCGACTVLLDGIALRFRRRRAPARAARPQSVACCSAGNAETRDATRSPAALVRSRRLPSIRRRHVSHGARSSPGVLTGRAIDAVPARFRSPVPPRRGSPFPRPMRPSSSASPPNRRSDSAQRSRSS
jgi:hypothetical protein